MKHILLLGDINIDVQMQVPALPPPGGEVLTNGLTLSLGGSASNTAVVLAKLGHAAYMLGRVGQDGWADIALRALSACGVHTTAVQRDPIHSTAVLFNAVTPDGERSMFTHRGANGYTCAADIPITLFDNADWLHLSGYALLNSPQRDAAWQAVQWAHARNIPISLDPALLPAQRAATQIRALLPYLTVCVMGLDEAAALSEDGSWGNAKAAAAAFFALGGKMLALKLGAAGCTLATRDGTFTAPAVPANVIDTTGAGDAFTAGVIHGYLNGWDMAHIGTCANRLGGLATEVRGAGGALPA